MTLRWSVPRAWEGETVAVIGGGPSLTPAQVREASRFRRIAVNDAGLTLACDADALVWGDTRWIQWNQDEIRRHTGKYKITWRPTPTIDGVRIHKLRNLHAPPYLSDDPGAVVANHSGMGAVNIAYLFGASRILLLGFDMRPSAEGRDNWHSRHREKTRTQRYPVFVSSMTQQAGELARRSVQVINCTPGSALDVYDSSPIHAVSKL